MGIVLAVILLVLVLFVTEALPLAITALLGVVLLMGTGILEPEEGLAGFSNTATITVLAIFVLSAGLERTGVIHRLTAWLLRRAGKNVRRQALVMGSVAGPLSGFVNNTAVVAILIPAALRLARESGRSPSKILMPLSFFAMTGGMLTIIGTSTNLLGNGLLPRLGIEPFRFFEFTLVGVAALLIALVYFLTIGFRLLPERGKGNIVDPLDLTGFLAEFQVPEDALVVGKRIDEVGFRPKADVQVVRHVRGGIQRTPRPEIVLEPGDMLVVQGSRERLESLTALTGLMPLPEVEHPLETEPEDEGRLATAEALIPPGSPVEGKSLAGLRFHNRYGLQVLAVRHHSRVAMGALAKARLSAGDVLLVQGTSDAIDRIAQDPGFVLTRERGREEFRTGRLWTAFGIMLAVVGLAAAGIFPIVVTALAGAVLMVMTGCLKMNEFVDSVHWDVVLLIAAAIPLGIALEKSGAAGLLASALIPMGHYLPPIVFLMVLFFITSLVTSILSNAAAVVVLLPITAAAAGAVDLDPRPFALAVILAASTSMLTPIGYQTNTMIYAAGRYRFADFTKVGGPLNLLLAVLLPFVILWLFPL